MTPTCHAARAARSRRVGIVDKLPWSSTGRSIWTFTDPGAGRMSHSRAFRRAVPVPLDVARRGRGVGREGTRGGLPLERDQRGDRRRVGDAGGAENRGPFDLSDLAMLSSSTREACCPRIFKSPRRARLPWREGEESCVTPPGAIVAPRSHTASRFCSQHAHSGGHPTHTAAGKGLPWVTVDTRGGDDEGIRWRGAFASAGRCGSSPTSSSSTRSRSGRSRRSSTR
jgi:hypothetical protein